jgi:hypothetical protein
MLKRIRIPIRSLGSEVADPALPVLAAWISEHRGIEADLITYKLEESVRVQSGIEIPSAGGRFYQSRLVAALGIIDGILSCEPAIDSHHIADDADRIVSLRKGAWCSLPAPHLWDIKDRHYRDEEELQVALCNCTGRIMRAMRDRGIKGHVLLCDHYKAGEIEELAGPKVLFYTENPQSEELSLLLERQHRLAIPAARVDQVLALLDRFEIRRLIVVDPSEAALLRVRSCYDPDSIEAGGYCRQECGEYWNRLPDSALITR